MQSMTGFGSGQAQGDVGSVTVEIRSVNSRYLDLSFRLPEELRHAEMPLREIISSGIRRGKVEVRANYTRQGAGLEQLLRASLLEDIQAAYERGLTVIPTLQAPTLTELLQWPDHSRPHADQAAWVKIAREAGRMALDELVANREREGQRLVVVMRELANEVKQNIVQLQARLPELLQLQQERLANRMRDVLEQAVPSGAITGAELSERIHAEAGLFSLRSDVAEELDRLNSHLSELQTILDGPAQKSGTGKRLDFLFQEMNREANTLGSKAAHLDVTRTAMDLKLLVEQLREQIQNIE